MTQLSAYIFCMHILVIPSSVLSNANDENAQKISVDGQNT